MEEIFEAEVFVETVFSLESYQNNGTWFYMSDYSTMDEFMTDCAAWFSNEETPEYIYKEWTGIPDTLITRMLLCPNFFEIREALRMIERRFIDPFIKWCVDNGHDLATDDVMMLVTRYQDYVPSDYEPPDSEISESEDNHCTEPLPLPLHLLLGQGFGTVEIFDDNYN
ncbi:MAG: hypothetical protein LBV38_00815 [Alistipes sp.]|jgi:hypothetical protein|nr:hypothetical protein [Alistipes sp.]